MEEKKAVLVVSFGTSYHETIEKNIAAAERAIAAALPDRTLFRAFTSGMILRKLARRDGLLIDDVPQALERIAAEGYTDVVVQPTHILPGEEYAKLLALAAPYAPRFAALRYGKPLLTGWRDYLEVARVLMEELPAPAEGEAVLLMGHGTEHPVNAAYAQLEYVLHDAGWDRAFVGTVEGYPALDQVLRRLAEYPSVTRVRLYPLMLVAGDHATNDMAGPDPDSWRSRLEAAGYAVSCHLQGLGESPGIRALLARRAAEA